MTDPDRIGGIVPDILLLRKSKCINEDRLAIDLGILPVIRLSATFSTDNRVNLPISYGIVPEMPFQSAIIMLESLPSLQIDGEIVPFMYPVLCGFSKMGSSDSPRRAALNASSAALSEGGQLFTAALASIRIRDVIHNEVVLGFISLFCLLVVCLKCECGKVRVIGLG
ncbi:hypothetical protein Tco_1247867 [Tanacetum coccineum]